MPEQVRITVSPPTHGEPLRRSQQRRVTHEESNGVWQHFLKDVTRTAVGVVAAEVWLICTTDDTTLLHRRGFYLEPAFDEGPEGGNLDVALNTFSSQPPATQPMIGLVGELWVELQEAGANQGSFRWSLLEPMAANEDAPQCARKLAASTAFGLVGAALLQVPGSSADGIMLLFSRSTDFKVGPSRSHLEANAAFLKAQALVGSAIAAGESARATLISQKRARHSAFSKMRALHQSGMLGMLLRRERMRLEQEGGMINTKPEPAACPTLVLATRQLISWLPRYLRKWRGVQRAPKLFSPYSRVAWETAAWTWFGVATTMLGLSGLNELVAHYSDGKYRLMLGSFGALVTLLFGAPSSPLAQPRNTIFGGLLCASVSVLFYYLSGTAFAAFLPKWLAVALAPATAIALSQRFGVLHPPAGAAALIFVSSGATITDLGWMYLVLPLLAGNVFCVLMATAINNLSQSRQYPLFLFW